MRYAMILKNRVIDILENCKSKPNYPPDKYGNPVISVECDETIKLGMFYIEERGEYSESFPEPIVEPEVFIPTQLDVIQALVEKSNNELRQEGADTAILELIKKGIL